MAYHDKRNAHDYPWGAVCRGGPCHCHGISMGYHGQHHGGAEVMMLGQKYETVNAPWGVP